MKIEDPDISGSYTYADYMTWSWTEMRELIRGKIYNMSPAPRTVHQKVVGKLYLKIGNFLEGKKCQAFVAPFDVRLPLSPKKKGRPRHHNGGAARCVRGLRSRENR